MYKLLMSIFLAACVAAGPTPDSASNGLDCFEQDNQLSCLMVKTYVALNKASRSGDFPIMDGVNFVREAPLDRTAKNLQLSERELLNELPRDNSDKMIKLASMIFESSVNFLKSHKLSVDSTSMSRALVEGRAKIKKMIQPVIAAIGIKLFALVPIVLGGLALLTMKALAIGKIALLVAGVLGFQKLFGHGDIGGYFKNPQLGSFYDNSAGWSVGSGHAPYNRRSMQDKTNPRDIAQDLAYSAHVPATASNTN